MDYLSLLKEAKRELGLADHILMVAFPIVRDKHIFLNVLTHADKSVILAIRAFIAKKKEARELRIIPESEELARRLFFEEFSKIVGITPSEKHLIQELKNVVIAHRKSQAEIKRGDEYIIFLPNFDSITINEQNVKRYLSIVRGFINKIEKVMTNGKP
ncbi:MAG: hypothetical protein J7K22_01960 [Nanoarchaeota archaeon]|nr:hypothetical protein [Nanoarchaeota archaeon]